MLTRHVTNLLGLPELEFLKESLVHKNKMTFTCRKKTKKEVCPKCATLSTTCYDKRVVTIKDTPVRGKTIFLKIIKRRFFCKSCKKPFTEPIEGIRKGFKSTTRFRKHIFWCACNFDNLKRVQLKNKCSSWMVYTSFYERAELEVRKLQNPWGRTVGIDEHSFVRNKKYGLKEFVTIFVDYNKSRVREVVKGRYPRDYYEDNNLLSVPGRKNVQNVITDFAPSMRSFAKSFSPNAMVIADKFHLVRLANDMVNSKRLEIMKAPENKIVKSRKNPLRKILLANGKNLKFYQQRALMYTFDFHRELRRSLQT